MRFLVTGTVLSQGIQFAASLLLTRLYTPAEFGQYSSILAVASVLGTIVVFAYPSAIPLAQTDDESRELAWLAITLAAVASAIATVVLGALAVSGIQVLQMTVGWQHVIFVPATCLVIAIWSTLQMRMARLSRFRQVGRATALGAITQASTQTAAGLSGMGASGLALGYLIGRLANTALLVFRSKLASPPPLRSMLRLARSWSPMTRWLVVTSTMNLIGTSAMAPWVARHYGADVAGSYALALQTLSVPAALIGQAVASVLFPRLAAARREGQLSARQVGGYISALASLAFPAFLPVAILGSELYARVFGSEWGQAGEIAAILCPYLAVSFVASPISSVVLVQGRHRNTAGIASIDTGLRIGAIAVGGSLGSAVMGFALFSMVGMVVAGCYLAWIMRLVGGSLPSLVVARWKGCCAAAVVTLVLLVLRPIVPFEVLTSLTVITSCVAMLAGMRRLRG